MSESLLTTAEAATFLRASQASVRRWADAGLLAASRIGRRGARRFREEDLLRFMGRTPGGSPPAASGLPRALSFQGMAVRLGSHLACLYGTDAGRVRVAVPFLREGLLANQTCLLYATGPFRDECLRALKSEEVDTTAAIKTGLLVLMPVRRTTIADWIAEFERLVAEARRLRSGPVRFVGDTSTGLPSVGSARMLFRLEQELTTVVKRLPVVMLCPYDARTFDGMQVMEALKTHFDTFDYQLGYFLS